jgi:putative hemolysin
VGVAFVVGVVMALAIGSPAASAASSTSGWSKPTVLSPGPPTSVSCTAGGFCAAVDVSGDVITSRDGQWSEPSPTDSNAGFASVSCPTSVFCVAGGGRRAVVYDGNAWSASTTVARTGGLTAISCPTSTFCVAVGGNGDSVTYTGSA